MIEVRKLCKSFNGKKVLNKIDLEIRENEIFTILGPSGHGKTVLIKLLVRLLEPDSGSISYDGQDISSLSKREFNEMYKKIAFIFQSNALFDYLDVKDNLSLYKKLHTKLSEKMIMDEVLEAIHFVGLGQDILNKFPEELSEGMKKRVGDKDNISNVMLQNLYEKGEDYEL
jgi:phospholipid/cholesterol/gamma-HCH transport system ATP-binding protein